MTQRTHVRNCLVVGCLAIVVLATAPVSSAELSIAQTSIEKARERPGREAVSRDAELLQKLRDAELGDGLAVPMRVQISSEELEALPPPGERRMRVGHTKALGAEIEFSSLRPRDLSRTARSLLHGAIAGTDGGGFVWSAAVDSPDAAALRLRFVGFFLPRDASLYLYRCRRGRRPLYPSRAER